MFSRKHVALWTVVVSKLCGCAGRTPWNLHRLLQEAVMLDMSQTHQIHLLEEENSWDIWSWLRTKIMLCSCAGLFPWILWEDITTTSIGCNQPLFDMSQGSELSHLWWKVPPSGTQAWGTTWWQSGGNCASPARGLSFRTWPKQMVYMLTLTISFWEFKTGSMENIALEKNLIEFQLCCKYQNGAFSPPWIHPTWKVCCASCWYHSDSSKHHSSFHQKVHGTSGKHE